MDDKENNTEENSISDSIEAQFDDLFAPREPDEDADRGIKSSAPDTVPVKKVKQKSPPQLSPEKEETARKVTASNEDQSTPNKSSARRTQQKFTPDKTLIKKPTPSVQNGRSKPVVKQNTPVEAEESPSEDTSKPAVENVFKKANQKYKKNMLWEKIKDGLNPLIFTLLLLLLVILSMFIGKIIIPDEVVEFFHRKSSAPVHEPVSVQHANKRKVIVSKDIKASSPKIDNESAKAEKKDIRDKDALKEEKKSQAATDVVLPVKKADDSPAVIEEKIPSYPYSIYLGSYGSIAKVKGASSDFTEMGITTYWVKLDLGEKGIWFRLFTGYFQSREEADLFIKARQLKEAESRLTKYTNLIGSYKTKEDIDRQKARLEELGYSSYKISDAGETYRLYAGAFYQKGRAEELKNDLELNGIKSELVER